MSRNGRKHPISIRFLSFLLFLDTFSLILDTKVSRNGNVPKSVTDAGPEQPFRCLDNHSKQGFLGKWVSSNMLRNETRLTRYNSEKKPCDKECGMHESVRCIVLHCVADLQKLAK